MFHEIKLLRNTFISVIRLGSTAFIFLLLSRILGADEAGIYYVARRYQLIFGVIGLWGLDELLIREISSDQKKSKVYLINYLFLRIMTGVASYLLMFSFVSITDYPMYTKEIICILSLSIIPDGINNLFYSAFISSENYLTPAIHASFLALFRIICIMIILKYKTSLVYIATLIFVSAILGVLFNVILILFRQNNVSDLSRVLLFDTSALNKSGLRQITALNELKKSLPFALTRIFFVFGTQGDVLIMSFYLSDKEIGQYGAAYSIVSFLLLLLYGFSDVLYPRLSKWYVENVNEFWKIVNQSLRIVKIVFVPIVFSVAFLSNPIIFLGFGGEFTQAVYILQWLLWAVVIQFLDVPYSVVIKSSRNQNRLTLVIGFGTIVNLILNIILIPTIGVIGAAISKLASTTVIYLHNILYTTHLSHKDSRHQIKWGFTVFFYTIGGSFLILYRKIDWYFYLLLVFLYYVILIISKDIKSEDLLIFKRHTNLN